MALQTKRSVKATMTRGAVRPGGRTERVRKAVLGAVLERLQAGDQSFTFQDVARISGVHVATIYARWPDRASLVMAAYEQHVRKLDIASSGDWEADLRSLAVSLREFLRDPVEMTANKLLITAGDESYREQMRSRFTLVVDDLARPLQDAKLRGEIRSDTDPILVIELLIAEILTITMFTSITLDDAYLARIVDLLIHACRV